jgi:hypothetical protein
VTGAAAPAFWSFLRRIGESDCEEFHGGLLAQPVNALTSFAYSVVGVVVIVLALRWDRWRGRTIIYGLCLVGTGLGSVVFHGPQWEGSRFLHDFPIVLVILLIALHDLSLIVPRFNRVPVAFVVVGALLTTVSALLPGAASIATGVLAICAVLAEIVVYRRHLRDGGTSRERRLLAAIVGLAAVAGGFYLLGRTGSPACDADSELQFHGLWHVVSAVAFGLWWWLALAERAPRTGPTLTDDVRSDG